MIEKIKKFLYIYFRKTWASFFYKRLKNFSIGKTHSVIFDDADIKWYLSTFHIKGKHHQELRNEYNNWVKSNNNSLLMFTPSVPTAKKMIEEFWE